MKKKKVVLFGNLCKRIGSFLISWTDFSTFHTYIFLYRWSCEILELATLLAAYCFCLWLKKIWIEVFYFLFDFLKAIICIRLTFRRFYRFIVERSDEIIAVNVGRNSDTDYGLPFAVLWQRKIAIRQRLRIGREASERMWRHGHIPLGQYIIFLFIIYYLLQAPFNLWWKFCHIIEIPGHW